MKLERMSRFYLHWAPRCSKCTNDFCVTISYGRDLQLSYLFAVVEI